MVRLAQALAELELTVAAALQQPGAPSRTILNAERSLKMAIETMPEARAVVLVEEAIRYVHHLGGSGHWDDKTAV